MKTPVISILLNSYVDVRLSTNGFDSMLPISIVIFKTAEYATLFISNAFWYLVIGHIFAYLKTSVRRCVAKEDN